MKTNIKILALFFVINITCSAQDQEDTFSTLFSTQQNSLNTLSTIAETDKSKIVIPKIQNQVFITQIGNNNLIETNVRSSFSTINLFQKGVSNEIFVDKSSDQLNQFITQEGFNNKVVDINLNSDAKINSSYIQTGNNLNLISIGTNSFSKEMTIKQTGNLETIIVLSK